MDRLQIIPSGDSALFCLAGESISEHTGDLVTLLNHAIRSNLGELITETVPSYLGVMVYFDPLRSKREQLSGMITELFGGIDSSVSRVPGRELRIPVCYGGDYGPDLQHVADHNRLSIEEVTKIHSAGRYRVYMLGFTPGFPYMGGMNPAIATPRKSVPSIAIEPGSVGIAGSQTGIYPIKSPGGWQVIGRTPVRLFTPGNEKEPFLLRAGDMVLFYPIEHGIYRDIEERWRTGRMDLTTGEVL